MKRCLPLEQKWFARCAQRGVVTAVFCLLACTMGLAQQTSHTAPDGTKFLMYNPPGYNASTPTPLLISLHGGSAIGDDLSILYSDSHETPAKLIHGNSWPSSYPFIVVSPQLKRDLSISNPNDQTWPPDRVDGVLEYVKTIRNVDVNRVYVTGISLGGAGTWSYAAAYPSKVAAIAPISGVTDVTQACQLKNIPVWAFHGGTDGLVPFAFTVDMVNAINACSPAGAYRANINLLHAQRHEGWDAVYDGSNRHEVFPWLAQFVKGSATNTAPYVNAGDDMTMLVRAEPVHLYGELFDAEGVVSTVQWTQTLGSPLVLANTNSRFLTIQNPQTGSFRFRLTVTDLGGLQSSDEVNVTFVSSSGNPTVTEITLINGATNNDVGALAEGQIVNKTSLGVTEFNMRASAVSQNTRSVRYRVNGDHNARSANSPYLIINRTNGPEWQMANGEYNVCATAYSQTGTRGAPGITTCFKITVTDAIVTTKNFYPKPNSDISQLSSWGLNTDGTGAAPASFTAAQQIFNVNKTVNVNNPLTISGSGSSFWVRANGNVTLNQALTAAINTEGNAIVNVSTAQAVTFGSIGNTSTVNFNGAATSIPSAAYGNLALKGPGTKTLPANNTSIANTLTIDNDVVVNGAADNSSVLSVGGTVAINENGEFNPSTKFGLTLTSGGAQALNVLGTRAVFSQLTLNANTLATLTGSAATTTLELGSAADGGLLVNNGAQLTLNNNHLTLVQAGSINNGNQNGRIAFKKSSVVFNTQAASGSNIYTVPGFDSLRALHFGNAAAGQLNIRSRLYIIDSVKCSNGTLQSNGFLTLVSTPSATARMAEVTGNGQILGEVEVQRYIAPGRRWRYMTFPVDELAISEVQPFIPVTGSFTGASTGAGLSSNPSLFYYDEATPQDWLPYPTTNNSAELAVGRGYSVFIRDDNAGTKLLLKGAVHTGDFFFTLTHATPVTASTGWNLLGNPYASPIQWGPSGWTRTNISNTIYVRDNSVEGGRFLVWDGTDGDEEFGGRIAQGQSFWVKATAASPELAVHEAAKTNTNPALFRRQSGSGASTLIVEMQGGALVDRTYVKFDDVGSEAFDAPLDAVKQYNGYFNITSRTSDGVNLVIDHRASSFCNQHISLAIDSAATGQYALVFKGAFFDKPIADVVLHDAYTGTATAITRNLRYSFQVNNDAQSYGNRFQLKLDGAPATPLVTQQGAHLQSSITGEVQWLLNGEPIDGATAAQFTPLASGTYQVRVTQGGCSTTSSPVDFVITGTETSRNAMRIAPNPATTVLRLYGDASSHTVGYGIVNVMGVECMEGSLNGATLPDGAEIDIAALRPGMYILVLKSRSADRRFRFVVE